MPTYGYRCEEGHEFEAFQGINDDPLKQCEMCSAPVRRIFYPVGIVFKGSGFYKTDSRGSSSISSPASKEDKSETSTKTEPAKADTKTESKSAGKGKTEKKSA